MHYFLQQCLNGLHSGALYALLAFGYVLTNGVLHRTNLAYGAVFAFCGHALILAATFAWTALWLEWWAAILFGALVATAYAWLIGSVLSRWVLRPLADQSPNAIVVATLAVGIVLMELSRISADTRDIWLPPMWSTPVTIVAGGAFPVTLTLNQLLGCAVATLVLIVATLALRRSRFGRDWRAVSDDPQAASFCGVNVSLVFRRAVIGGCFFAALAGAIAALHYGNISFGTGLIYGLKILFVTAAGSYSAPDRAAAGAFAYGVGEALWAGYFPIEWRDAWMLAFLVALLILRRAGSGIDEAGGHMRSHQL